MDKVTQLILSEKEIKSLISEYVKSHGYTADLVSFNILEESKGFGPTTLFGATVTVRKEKVDE